MAKVNIPPLFLLALEKVQHAIIISSKNGEIQWSNGVAARLFDFETVKKVIVRKRLINKAYGADKVPDQITLPSLLNFPVSFNVMQGMDFQILMSSNTVSTDRQLLRRSVAKVVESNVFQPAGELESAIELLLRESNSGVGLNSELQQKLKKLERILSKFREQKVEAKSLLEGLEFGIEKNDRIDVIKLTEAVTSELDNHQGKVQSHYYNHEYGVLYGDQGLLAETLGLLISSTIESADENRPMTIAVYQERSEVVWRWEGQFDQLSRYAELLCGFQGGQIEKQLLGGRLIFSVRMLSGGTLKASDNDLALWLENSEKELAKVKS